MTKSMPIPPGSRLAKSILSKMSMVTVNDTRNAYKEFGYQEDIPIFSIFKAYRVLTNIRHIDDTEYLKWERLYFNETDFSYPLTRLDILFRTYMSYRDYKRYLSKSKYRYMKCEGKRYLILSRYSNKLSRDIVIGYMVLENDVVKIDIFINKLKKKHSKYL